MHGRRRSNFPVSARHSRRGNPLDGSSHLRRLTPSPGKCSVAAPWQPQFSCSPSARRCPAASQHVPRDVPPRVTCHCTPSRPTEPCAHSTGQIVDKDFHKHAAPITSTASCHVLSRHVASRRVTSCPVACHRVLSYRVSSDGRRAPVTLRYGLYQIPGHSIPSHIIIIALPRAHRPDRTRATIARASRV